jgi:hypothetical protein
MSQTLELIIKLRDEVTAEIKKLGPSMQSALQAVPLISAAAMAYGKIVKTSFDLAKGYMEYVISVGDLASKTGMGMEEAAAVVELASRTGTTIDQWVRAFTKMAVEGIEPSIGGLVEVKRKLDEAAGPGERLAEAKRLLGAYGQDLIPILDSLGRDGLVTLAIAMQGAVGPTQAEYKEMLGLRDVTGEFNSHMEDFKRLLGEGIIDNTGVVGILERWNGVLSGTVGYFQALANYVGIMGGTQTGRADQYGSRGGTGALGPGPSYYTPPKTVIRGMAMGGPVGGYIVGEHGAERFTPGQSGTVSPANDELTREMRRLLRTLPVILRDAVEKAK